MILISFSIINDDSIVDMYDENIIIAKVMIINVNILHILNDQVKNIKKHTEIIIHKNPHFHNMLN